MHGIAACRELYPPGAAIRGVFVALHDTVANQLVDELLHCLLGDAHALGEVGLPHAGTVEVRQHTATCLPEPTMPGRDHRRLELPLPRRGSLPEVPADMVD